MNEQESRGGSPKTAQANILNRFSPEFLGVALVVIAVFLAAMFDAWRISRATDETTYIPKPAVVTPAVELLQEYIRIDTSNPPGRELEAATWIANRLKAAGIGAEIIESAPGRANVYAKLEGRSEGRGLLLTHHIDVVPADGDLWTEPPFAANVRLNQLYGRGTLDMKSIGICHLLAFIDLAESGEPLENDVVFLAVADEEEGGALGMGWLVRNRPDIFEGIRYALNEGGVAESLADEITYFGVEVGTKQLVFMEIRDEDRRQLERVRTALLPFQSPEDVTRVIPEVPPTLKALSFHRRWGRELIADVEKTIAEGRFWRLHNSYKYLMQNVLVMGGIKEAGAVYRLEAILYDLPDQEPEQEIEKVRSVIEALGAELVVNQVQGPAPVSSWTTPFFHQIEQAVETTYGDVAVGPQILQYSSNDSRFLRPMGIQAYGLWPFPVTLYQTFGVHGADERVRLDWFEQGVELTRRLTRAYALGRELSQPSDN